ncbi:AAA family ATPase [Nannocystis sp. SCPEA4]|uniref:AAA family ATPase n=1 Tax=Nannocystis sp. SCPEA4 TaxID=2996787 RepID=UPI002270D2EB|nr:AAA family ATPase [Nannocystis sp. SCPEA4]MCY1059488.1 AAA family ATPase [Nannocystis sp. SCPEA4]
MAVQAAYTLTDKLHEGVGTVIHRAVRTRDGARVILKIARGGPLAPVTQGALRQEFAVLRSLDLPGVIKAHALEAIGDELALVLEDGGGRSLDVLFHAGALDLGTVLAIGVEVAGILDLLHRYPLLHRDIKPHNIVYDPATRQVTLIDFTLAVTAGEEPQRTAVVERTAGTLAYMSPEQTGRMNRPIDARSDLYSLGATLYELLTGALPFDAADAMALVHSQLARVPVAPAARMTGVPQVVSDIVMKLLAKAAEDRYQSAAGLKADLQRCATAWATDRAIEPFALGSADRPSTPRIPARLYGRQAEIDALLDAFTRVADGAAMLLLVRGWSGAGKSALIHTLAAPVARGGGFFVEAKCDQYDRGVPYAPIAQVFRELCRSLLTAHPEALAAWRGALAAALGSSGKLLTDLIPELELIVGPQPDVPRLGPAESQNRFNLIFTALLRVFARADHPLVLFFDDLQWIDPASLRLLQEMLFDPECGYLLVLGAYRDHELGAGHPLPVALAELRAAGVELREFQLGPLAFADVEELLADTLVMPRPQVVVLARIVGDKTHCNPFFIGQFLLLLAEERLLRWDAQERRWVWDDAEIAAQDVTDNVVVLVTGKIRRLGPGAQRLLQLAACIGYRFAWPTLAAIADDPDAGAALGELVREGLVVPLAGGVEGEEHYRFLHDRVQQAADSLLADDARRAAHLRVGRLLRDHHSAGVPDDALFEVVGHLDLALAHIAGEERTELARLNLRAGRRARAAAAYHAARRYFQAGSECLGADAWSHDYALAFALRVELAECTYLCGGFAEADELFSEALAQARTRGERAQVYNLRVLLYAAMGDFEGVVAAGGAALALYDVALPDEGPALQAAVEAAFAATRVNLGGRPIASLLDASGVRDADVAMVMQLLASMSGPVFVGKPALFPLIVLHMVNLSLQHGTIAGSDYSYSVYGLILAGAAGELDKGYEFGELGVNLNERIDDLHTRCMVHFLFGTSLVFYREPYAAGEAWRESARRVALEVGNFAYVSFYCLQSAALALLADADIRAAATRFDDLAGLLRRTRDAASTAVVEFMRRVAVNLLGDAPTSALAGDGFDEDAFVAALPPGGLVPWLYAVSKLRLAYLYGEYDHGAALAARAGALQATGAGAGHMYTTEQSFYAGLTAAARWDEAPADRRAALCEELTQSQAALRVWSASNPTQFAAMQLLLDAEAARLAGRDAEAIAGYEQAIAAAQARGFALHAALASECAGRWHLRRGRRSLAVAYLQDAHAGFVRWGATAKANQLAAVHAELLAPAAPGRPAHASGRSTTTTRALNGSSLDVEGLLRAAQAVAGELVLDRLLDRLMRIVMLRAGAQRGFLLVPHGEAWSIAAEMQTAPDEVRVGLDRLMGDDAALATAVVRFVARSREVLVLADASAEPRFSRDPYVAAHRPRSVLCLPLLHQGRLSGLLYVENNATRDAFAPERVELLQLLSAQAAVAIDNARLYASVQQAHEQLTRANEALEQQVETRTRDLQAAIEQLQDVNADLARQGAALREAHAQTQREIGERERAERERAAAQAEILRVQEERLADMAAPLLPITETIVVMPLIGLMDEARATHVLATALAGAVRTRAQVVILDITGVRQLDATAAAILVRAASALRLVGAQTILTGVRPDTAQLLVRDQAALAGLVTLGTLQSGMTHALAHTRSAASPR